MKCKVCGGKIITAIKTETGYRYDCPHCMSKVNLEK